MLKEIVECLYAVEFVRAVHMWKALVKIRQSFRRIQTFSLLFFSLFSNIIALCYLMVEFHVSCFISIT